MSDPDETMRWRVLGPMEVRAGKGWAGVGAPKWRALLAALLAAAGGVVSTGSLVDELWGDNPPTAARKLVSGYVLRLRRLIGDPEGGVLVTQAPGYRLAVTRAEVDAGWFGELAAAGHQALVAGDPERAAGLCAEALDLWRGTALADVPAGPLAVAEASRLEELRLETVEVRIEAGLRCGSAAGLVPELRWLTAAYPLRERFWHQLMRVLEEGGRQAEALAAYAQAREVIAEELGADPGLDLRQLHQRILVGGPPAAAVASVSRVVPRQLPGAVRHFAGRAAELQQLSALLGEAVGGSAAVVISAIGGTAGVGKTALAVHWAHQVAELFGDGQLYVNLRGYDPGRPVVPADALAGFLRALGVDGRDIPAEGDERAARYRSLLAGRRVLVLLDNAGEVEQVRPLLPGTPGCLAVVTSRDSLAGLVARDGARRLDLDLLPAAEAAGLLLALIGQRAAADPAATAALADLCCRLPLALRVVAEFAAARPGVSLADLAGELADLRRRLDLLDAGADPRTAVRAVFSWSYRHLDPGTARTFRLAGLHLGPDFDRYAVAALAGASLDQATRALDILASAHLIDTTRPGRYCLHDLLRAYARELAASKDGQDEQRAALTRLFDLYLQAAAAAMDALVPAERHRRPSIPPSATPPPLLASPVAARAWLDTERASLVAVAGHTAACGWPGYTTRLAATLFRYLDVGGHVPDAITIHTSARAAARQTGDRPAEAAALINLGLADFWQGRCQQATGSLRQALALYRQTSDHSGEARALANLGAVAWRQGLYQEATSYHRQALALYRDTGDRTGEARALTNLGIIDQRQGRYQQATSYHRLALGLYRDAGDRPGEASALGNLGDADRRQGRYQQATGHLRQALALFRDAGDQTGEAYALIYLGDVDRRQASYLQAADHLRQALALCRQTGHRAGEAAALNGLGEVLLATGKPDQARAEHTAALGLASQIGDQDQQARAHHGLGRAYHAAGDPGQGRGHWQQALVLYSDLGDPEADDVRAHLGAAGEHDTGEP